MELENGTLEKEHYIEIPSIFGFQPLIFGSVCFFFVCVCVSVAFLFSSLLFFVSAWAGCKSTWIHIQMHAADRWTAGNQQIFVGRNIRMLWHLQFFKQISFGALSVLNHHPVTVLLNQLVFGLVEVSLDQLQPCQEKWEWPETGKCLCLFDLDRTLTSRSPESRKICFRKQQPQQVWRLYMKSSSSGIWGYSCIDLCVCMNVCMYVCMLWYGMVWYGMVWYGMVWYGMYVMYVCYVCNVCM